MYSGDATTRAKIGFLEPRTTTWLHSYHPLHAQLPIIRPILKGKTMLQDTSQIVGGLVSSPNRRERICRLV